MPKLDGTLTYWERAQLSIAQKRYNEAVSASQRHPQRKALNEAQEKRTFAELMVLTARYGGCR